MNTSSITTLFCGQIWHVVGDAFATAEPGSCLRVIERGALAVDAQGRIAALGDAGEIRAEYPQARVVDFGERMILPGFIDTHLHFPQLDIIGSYGEQLIGWLNRYTFPTEATFADATIAQATAARLITELYANGTTFAVAFSSAHKGATAALFREAERRGLRGIFGKVAMDRNAPQSMLQDPDADAAEQEALINQWHGREGRLFYALSPRFAPTCTAAMLARHGELRARYEDVFVQTHWVEQLPEDAWVRELFPAAKDYLAVYEQAGLLGPRTILAHAVHADAGMFARVAAAGAIVAHCPTSNLFLGSGLFPLDLARAAGVKHTLATDIGGGTSLSIWRTMDEAYKVQQLAGRSVHPVQLLAWATLQNAEALGFGESLGNFLTGKQADFQVLEPRNIRLLEARFARTQDPVERLFAMVMLGDDRMTEAVYVGGARVYEQLKPEHRSKGN